MNRRRALSLAGSVTAFSLSGCSGSPEETDGQTEDQTNEEPDPQYAEYDEPGLADVGINATDIDFENIQDDFELLLRAHSEVVKQVGATVSSGLETPSDTIEQLSIVDSEEDRYSQRVVAEGEAPDYSLSSYVNDEEGFVQLERPSGSTEYLYIPSVSEDEADIGAYTGAEDDELLSGIEDYTFELVDSGQTGHIEVFEYSITSPEQDGDGFCIVSEQGTILHLQVDAESRTTELRATEFGETIAEEPSWVSEVDKASDEGEYMDWLMEQF